MEAQAFKGLIQNATSVKVYALWTHQHIRHDLCDGSYCVIAE